MKKLLVTFALALAIAAAFHWKITSEREAAFNRQKELWAKEKGDLEAELGRAKNAAPLQPTVVEKKQFVEVAKALDPNEIITSLQQVKIFSGGPQTKNTRVAIQHFENLIVCGTNAIPAIREFLLLNQEIDYDSWISPRGSRDGRVSTTFVLPPSLRFGMFDALRQIGGPDAEGLLVETLQSTGRGVEVAYLARALDEMAPNKYRDLAVESARALLMQPLAQTNVGLDRYDREYLFGLLAFFGDSSFAAQAQTQLVREDGSIDRGALRYLQQTAGEQQLAMLTQMYQDPKVNADGKERLGRYALNYAGLNPYADNLWQTAILDKSVDMDERRELIEDLNQDGFDSTRNPTPRDLLLITNRLALIERHRVNADHRRITDAFSEAERDLRRMLERATNQPRN